MNSRWELQIDLAKENVIFLACPLTSDRKYRKESFKQPGIYTRCFQRRHRIQTILGQTYGGLSSILKIYFIFTWPHFQSPSALLFCSTRTLLVLHMILWPQRQLIPQLQRHRNMSALWCCLQFRESKSESHMVPASCYDGKCRQKKKIKLQPLFRNSVIWMFMEDVYDIEERVFALSLCSLIQHTCPYIHTYIHAHTRIQWLWGLP